MCADMPVAAVVIPTLNAASQWPDFSRALLSCVNPAQVLIIDSSSTDGTPALAQGAGFRLHSIPRAEFNHGGTRQSGIELLPDADIVVFMTQDSVPASAGTVEHLLRSFGDPAVAAAFGRQLPRPNAGPIEAHARLFNYPRESGVRSLDSRKALGFRAIFISNSFAAYRRSALMAVGGFPSNVIFGEDMVTAARLLLEGWKIAYVADADVYHSHSYTYFQEFRRYFDIGVLHARNPFLLREFGQTGGEGKRFVLSELAFLRSHAAWLIPSALVHTASKLGGYRLGRVESILPVRWKKVLSMNRNFWR